MESEVGAAADREAVARDAVARLQAACTAASQAVAQKSRAFYLEHGVMSATKHSLSDPFTPCATGKELRAANIAAEEARAALCSAEATLSSAEAEHAAARRSARSRDSKHASLCELVKPKFKGVSKGRVYDLLRAHSELGSRWKKLEDYEPWSDAEEALLVRLAAANPQRGRFVEICRQMCSEGYRRTWVQCRDKLLQLSPRPSEAVVKLTRSLLRVKSERLDSILAASKRRAHWAPVAQAAGLGPDATVSAVLSSARLREAAAAAKKLRLPPKERPGNKARPGCCNAAVRDALDKVWPDGHTMTPERIKQLRRGTFVKVHKTPAGP